VLLDIVVRLFLCLRYPVGLGGYELSPDVNFPIRSDCPAVTCAPQILPPWISARVRLALLVLWNRYTQCSPGRGTFSPLRELFGNLLFLQLPDRLEDVHLLSRGRHTVPSTPCTAWSFISGEVCAYCFSPISFQGLSRAGIELHFCDSIPGWALRPGSFPYFGECCRLQAVSAPVLRRQVFSSRFFLPTSFFALVSRGPNFFF